MGDSSLKINDKWYLILETVRELNERRYALKVGRTVYQKICYVLTRNGVNTGFKFVKGTYGPYSSQINDSITALANANLIIEKQLGRMLAIMINDSVEIQRDKYSDEEWDAVKRTVDLFGRFKSTSQAEMAATVLFAYDQLKKEKSDISDKDVYDYVLNWKPRWNTEKETYDLCETIQSLAMLSQMNVTYSNELIDTTEFY